VVSGAAPRTNPRNRAVYLYRRLAPAYDLLLGPVFPRPRRRALDLLAVQPGGDVVLVGVGTGLDLPLLPVGVRAVGLDLSGSMLARAQARLPMPGRQIDLVEADAVTWLRGHPGAFDAAVLTLVLSVVPDGTACLHAAVAALRPGGRLVVFDKFAPASGVSRARRIVNVVASRVGTDITRAWEPMLAGSGADVVREEPALRGLYRVVLLRRR